MPREADDILQVDPGAAQLALTIAQDEHAAAVVAYTLAYDAFATRARTEPLDASASDEADDETLARARLFVARIRLDAMRVDDEP